MANSFLLVIYMLEVMTSGQAISSAASFKEPVVQCPSSIKPGSLLLHHQAILYLNFPWIFSDLVFTQLNSIKLMTSNETKQSGYNLSNLSRLKNEYSP